MATKSKKQSRDSNRLRPTAKKLVIPTPVQAANGNGCSPSNRDMLRRMYSAMLKCHMMDKRLRNSNASDAYDFTTGHEAVVIGASVDLRHEDTIVASSRNFAARIAMGALLKSLLKDIGANHSDENLSSILSCRSAPCGSISSAVFSADPFNLATGVALFYKLEKKTNVVVAFRDEDAAALEASYGYEGLKFAGIHKLPIVYVTKGGLPNAVDGRKHSALEEFSFVARDYGFPSILVDGRDAVAVRRAAQESIHRARSGTGPTLIECQIESSSFDDPLTHMQHYMIKRGAWDEGWKRQIVAQINAGIEEGMRTP